ncbi:hypothetical protein BV20DRAFT_692228 [Pilatotrama ljubarskyi]|nr:hypothetical protein BV20DRAFT_692228 [Pilatotrama ljubarskyi]
MSGLEEVLQDVGNNLPLLNLVKFAGVFSSTILFLEIISTLEDEIRLIWPSRWSIMKFVYLGNRYSPLIDTTLGLTVMLFTTDPKSCQIQFEVLTYCYAFGSFFSEAILMARTLALYDFSRYVVVTMAALGLGIIIPGVIVCHSLLSSLHYPDRSVLRIIGCVPSIDDRPGWVLYMCILISETVVVSLTLSKMWHCSRDPQHRSLLVHTMYRDGSLYYVLLLVLSITNLCFMLLAPKPASSVIQMPLRVVHSTLCTRVLLNLRKVAAKLSDMSLDEFTRRSHIAFEPVFDETHPASYVDLELGDLDDEFRYR